jgi:arylsulfatase A-like enzyme
MGCYGDTLATTPNVDALAVKGMIFTHAWSCAPVCAAARTTLWSGMHATSMGAEQMRSLVPYPAGKKMLPQLLSEAGYYCAGNGKEDYNVDKPDGTWDESSGKAHWKNRAPGQPFFAYFNNLESHEGHVHNRQGPVIHDPAKVRVPAYHPDTPEVREEWARYYDAVTKADAAAGRHLKEIAKAGLTQDTIVFYFADHGAGIPRSKRWPGNSGLQVPVVVYFPEKYRQLAPKEYQPGGKSERLINFVDFAPTLLSIAGIKPPEWMQGNAFAGNYQEPPQAFSFGFRGRMDERYDVVRSVTDGRYVYLRNYMPHLSQAQHVSIEYRWPYSIAVVWRKLYEAGKLNAVQSIYWQTPKAPEELYDLQSDPDEVRNLANAPEHQTILLKLRTAQQDNARKIRDVAFVPEGERFARTAGASPYDFGHDESKYPFERVFATAELASWLKPTAVPELRKLMTDSDSTVRYWATLGMLMRGASAVTEAHADLEQALTDASPDVRITAAWALADYGSPETAAKALAMLGECASRDKNNIFVSMAALTAIDNLGMKAASLRDAFPTWQMRVDPPNPRYDSNLPALMNNIRERFHLKLLPTKPVAKGKKTPSPEP